MPAKQKILIVDDDTNIAELISLYLTKEFYQVQIVEDGEQALQVFDTFQPNLVLLDLMLPGMDGYQVCRELRSRSNTPIIMLSAKGEVFDKVLGLELGADDYMIKPFDSKELVARVKAVLRRCSRQEEDKELKCDDLRLSVGRHKVYWKEEKVELTRKEFELLQYLMENKGLVMTRNQILCHVWGYDFDGETRTVDVHVRTLRQKLGEAGNLIETVRGVGYRIGV